MTGTKPRALFVLVGAVVASGGTWGHEQPRAATLPVGTSLHWKDEVIGKDSLCYEVERGCLSGYVLASARAHRVEDRATRPAPNVTAGFQKGS